MPSRLVGVQEAHTLSSLSSPHVTNKHGRSLLDGALAGFVGELAVDFNYVCLRVTASAA